MTTRLCSAALVVNPRKANHHTLEALAQFSQKHPEAKWKMVLVGEGGERRALAEQAECWELKTTSSSPVFRIRHLITCAFDAFILASKSEGLPRVVLEAMLLNIPVIGSQVTGTAELIDHDSTGLLFPWSDVSQLAQHLDNIWADADLRADWLRLHTRTSAYLCHRKLCQCRSRFGAH
jgi:glycosyltransferase involved in cell wall biosynthesis